MRPARRAFSLIELLTVVAIVALLSGLGAAAFNGTGGASVSTAVSQVSTTLSLARQLAVASNCRTRFVIFRDTSVNPQDWRMRRYGIMKEVTDVPAGSSPYFQLAGPLMDLRSGLIFDDNAGDEGTGLFASAARATGQVLNVQSAEYSYVEFLPSGGTTATSRDNIFKVGRGAAPGSPVADDMQYALVGVAQHTGRVKIERAEPSR